MDPLDELLGLERLGIKFGLENIRALCAVLGDPFNAYRSVIVAGTNGKGSVTAMVDRALMAAGYRSARYTSPHLVHLEERFAIDGRPVSPDTLRAVANDVLAVVHQLRAAGALATEPTFFEVTTAIGFEIFRRAKADIAVVEVGMGGRFDATNVVTPVAAAITTIDFDHERFLGHTIAEIAVEKAGVIKPGMTVIVGESKPDAVAVITAACRERGARCVMAGEGVHSALSRDDGQLILDLTTPARRYPCMRLALRGRHQAANAIVAVRLLEELPALGLEVAEAAIVAGLTEVRWPGRLDLVEIDNRRRVLFDSAHNPAGARALAEYLRETYPGGLPIVFGAMRDKDAAAMIGLLAPHATRFVFTEPPNPRAAAARVLAGLASQHAGMVPVEIEPDPRAALERAFRAGPLVVVAGSIFLVGKLLSSVPSNPLR
jgi:dihydrofolate synthase / folylpolyglutamate synthase